MKSKYLVLYILTFSLSTSAHAQNHEDVSRIELESLISKMSDSLAYYYVSVEEGVKIGKYIQERFDNGFYNSIHNPDSLARQLTEDLRMITNDLHLYVSHNHTDETNHSTIGNLYTGLSSIKFYDNSIVYMKFDDFGNWNNANHARQTISNLAPILQRQKALIIDVRNNPGGVPYVVSYLLSYFFDDEVRKFANYYIRYNNSAYSIYSEPNIPGNKYPDLPIYVLVNDKTASAGEELAFWLQGQQRATVIGQKTMGAGYGAMEHSLNSRFSISISDETEVDPTTNRGFQIIGVQPDIRTQSGQSLNKALELASKEILSTSVSGNIDDLKETLNDLPTHNIEDSIIQLIKDYHNKGLIDHSDINQLGYEYMEEPEKAVAILKTNTLLYPFYPNCFDSYADALFANKEYERAKENYHKAIELATLKNNRSLEIYKTNLKNFQIQYDAIAKEENAIKAVLMDYIEGTSNGEIERLKKAFHPELNLYSVDKTEELKIWRGQEYINAFKEGEKTNRVGRILSIDYEHNAASAKVEIKAYGRIYIDYFLLLKLKGHWTIIHKSYTSK